ncbi:hypothetical protein N9793_00710 [bacterium]|nr:hypothetical protein [bacterium]
MDYHYRFVLPHKSNSKPEKDADKEEKDIVRDKVHTSHSVTNKLDHGSQPFYCIDSQHFVCHRLNPCMGAVRLMRTRIGLLAQPESMR